MKYDPIQGQGQVQSGVKRETMAYFTGHLFTNV